MGKIAFVFSGQGDQYPGMGRELADKYPAAAKVYEICDSIRPGTSRQCFEGTDEELKETKNTQPCLFATELATAAADRSGCRRSPDLPVRPVGCKGRPIRGYCCKGLPVRSYGCKKRS